MTKSQTAVTKVVIMAGGTGGHVFPGIALAQAFAQRGITTHWLGTAGGMESEWVTKAGLNISTISIKGLRGNGLKGWLLAPFKVVKAFIQARRILKQQAPGLVVGMGGFVCGPGGLAARSLGIDLYLHEQNAIPGLTNKLLAPLAKRVFCGFPPVSLSSEKVEVVGNPVRAEIEAVAPLQQESIANQNTLLIIGGSRGARALNQVLPQALKLIDQHLRPKIQHQTGEADFAATQQAYAQAGVEADVQPFIENMAQAYAQARIVVARSGALTVSELMAVGRPAILIPFPFAVDDHQTANAQVMQKLSAADVIQQNDLTSTLLAQRISHWFDPQHALPASVNLHAAAKLGAAEQLVERVLSLTEGCESGV